VDKQQTLAHRQEVVDHAAQHEAHYHQQLQHICEAYESRIDKLSCGEKSSHAAPPSASVAFFVTMFAVLQNLQVHQQAAVPSHDTAAAHHRDFQSLKMITAAALEDCSQLQRLLRSIDVTGNPLRPSQSQQRL
jgi:hypothetical protein